MPPELLDATGYRDFFEILMAAGEAAMAELRERAPSATRWP